MQKTILSQKAKIFGLALLLVFGVLLCLKLWPANIKAISKQAALPMVEVKNETESFIPVSIEYVGLDGKSSSIEDENGMVKLQLKNTSTKTVIGYVLTFGKNRKTDTDLLIGGGAMLPGQTREDFFSVVQLKNPLNADERPPVTIALVVFDDHSSEGDFGIDRQIRDKHRGIKAYLQLASHILTDTQTFAGKDSLSRLSNIKHQLSARYEQLGDKQSESFKSGLHLAKEITGELIDDLSQWESSGRTTNLASAALRGSKDANEGVKRIVAWSNGLINKY